MQGRKQCMIADSEHCAQNWIYWFTACPRTEKLRLRYTTVRASRGSVMRHRNVP
jgi:hypothetical protein